MELAAVLTLLVAALFYVMRIDEDPRTWTKTQTPGGPDTPTAADVSDVHA